MNSILWKFNKHLLCDKSFVGGLINLIKEYNDKNHDMTNKNLKWEYMKCLIREFCIAYSKKTKHLQICQEYELQIRRDLLEQRLSEQNQNISIMEEFNIIPSELENIYKIKENGARIRSRVDNLLQGESNNQFLKSLEYYNYTSKHIRKLEKEDGSSIELPSQILKYQKEFYQNLYTPKSIDSWITKESESYFFENLLDKLSIEQKSLCDAEISLTECKEAVMSLKDNKTPGSDGLTTEFYKFFWDHIKVPLIESFQYSFQTGELSVEQKRGILRLLPKKNKNPLFLKNWRSISLLNTDYQMISVISNILNLYYFYVSTFIYLTIILSYLFIFFLYFSPFYLFIFLSFVI